MTHPAVRKRFASLAARHRDRRPAPERLLSAMGIAPALVESVLGDLAEERGRIAASHGARAAHWWYMREFLRSVPPLAWSAVRHLSPDARLRFGAWLASGTLITGLAVFLLSIRDGPPARLVADVSPLAGGVVVNNVRRPVQLPLRVLDKAGHALPTTDVRYAWVSGVPVTISPDGALSCERAGDAVITASLGSLATNVRVLCRPVSSVMTEYDVGLVVGGPSGGFTFLASDAEGRAVGELTGTVTSRDTSVVALHVKEGRYRLTARSAGTGFVDVTIGEKRTTARVTAYAPVATLEGLRPGQRRVAAAVRLAPGATRRWRVAPGTYTIEVLPDHDGRPMPQLFVVEANCLPAPPDARSHFCAAAWDFWVIAHAPPEASAAAARSGYVALWRRD